MKHLVVVLSAGLFLAAGLSGCQTGSGMPPQAAGEGEMHTTAAPTVDLETRPVSFPANEDLILLPMPRSLASGTRLRADSPPVRRAPARSCHPARWSGSAGHCGWPLPPR